MRFSIAAASLANSFAVVPSSQLVEAVRAAKPIDVVNDEGRGGRILGARRRSLRRQDGESLFPLLGGSPLRSIDRPRLINSATASGRTNNEAYSAGGEGRSECDPAADVGLLSCAMGQYCIQSTGSALGGVCADKKVLHDAFETSGRRWLEGNRTIFDISLELCNTTLFPYYTCDCNLDYEAFTGTFSCEGGERCATIETGCSDYGTFQYCFSGTVEGKLDGPTTYSYTTWMPESNYVFEYCTNISLNAVDGLKCDIEVDGVMCNSCEVDVGGGNSYGENCEVFDCTNTPIRYAGDRCGVFASPTLLIEAEINYRYQEHWPCADGCNLCGENGFMTKGKSSFNYTPPFLAAMTTFECYDIMYGAMIGGLSETNLCDALPPLANEPCGCEGGSTAAPVEVPLEQPPSPTVEDIDSPTEAPAENEIPNQVPPSTGVSHFSLVTEIIQLGGMTIALWCLKLG